MPILRRKNLRKIIVVIQIGMSVGCSREHIAYLGVFILKSVHYKFYNLYWRSLSICFGYFLSVRTTPSVDQIWRYTGALVDVGDLLSVYNSTFRCQTSVAVTLNITVGVSSIGQPSNLISSKPVRLYRYLAKVIFRPCRFEDIKKIIYNCLFSN